MKLAIVIGFTLVAAAGVAGAQSAQYVPGYFRADGTYVQGYYRTVPDHNPYNNYSARGNVNPYTGRPGTVNPYVVPRTPLYMPNVAESAMQGLQQGQEMRLRQLEIQRLQRQERQRQQEESTNGSSPYWVLTPPSSG